MNDEFSSFISSQGRSFDSHKINMTKRNSIMERRMTIQII